MSWIDLHCHLPMLEADITETLKIAKENDVERLVTIGTCPEDHPKVLDFALKYHPIVHCTLGVHPHEAKTYSDDVEAFIRENVTKKEVIAVAEIGLDYFYEHSPKDIQKNVFRRQLQLAQDLQLPVQIHTRDAEKDTVDILKEFGGQIKGNIHCFTGSPWLAENALNLGLNISLSGIVTFKNAEDLRETAKAVPLDRMHVETDSPFLTPVPLRGQKNTPGYVRHVGEFMASFLGIDLLEFQKQMKENALNTFTKIEWQ